MKRKRMHYSEHGWQIRIKKKIFLLQISKKIDIIKKTNLGVKYETNF